MKKLLLCALVLLGSYGFACGHCSLFVFQKYKEFALSQCPSKNETEIVWMHPKEIPGESLEYFYMGQICAYQDCIEDLQYRIEFPTCSPIVKHPNK